MFNLSVKSFLGYGSSKESHEKQFRSIEREGFLLAATQTRPGDLDRPEMTEAKRAGVTEQLSIKNSREITSTRERTTLDNRRKDSVRGQMITLSCLNSRPSYIT